jgi:hypothetical protein
MVKLLQGLCRPAGSKIQGFLEGLRKMYYAGQGKNGGKKKKEGSAKKVGSKRQSWENVGRASTVFEGKVDG